MKILYVINSLNMGGAEKLCVDLIKLGKKKQVNIDLYILNNIDTDLKKDLIYENIKIFNAGTNKYKSIKHINWLIKNKNKYDVIHSHLSYSQYYISILRLIDKKIKLVTTEHSTFNGRRKYKIFKLIEKCMYNSYDKIAVINEENKRALYEWQNKIKNKIIVVENGIDINKYKNGNLDNIKDKVLIKNKNKNKLLMIAAFREEKNHMFMLETLKEMDNSYVLILVGDGDGEIKNNILDFVHENNLKERIVMLGVRKDVEDIIKFCDIAVLPSRWEGFGLAAVECMAGGLPIIGSNVKGLAEVIGNEKLLFEKNNKKDLIKSVDMIFKDKQIYNDMKNYCMKKSSIYDLNFTFDKYFKIYIG